MMYLKDDVSNKFTFLIADIKATYHVADDIYIWQKSKSTFGGLFQKTQQYLERRPHTVTIDEAALVMNYFDMVALQKFSGYLTTYINASKLTNFLE